MTHPTVLRWRSRERSRRIAAYGTGVVAVVSLLSAVSQPSRARFEVALELLPFTLTRSAATTLVFVAVAQLLAARGLRRGQRLAWVTASGLLAATALLHLIKAADVEESVLAVVGLVWLATQHAAFPVLPSQAVVRRSAFLGVGGATAVVVTATALVLVVGRRQHPGVGESARAVAARLGGQTSVPLPGVGPLLGPMLAAAGLALLAATLWVLLSPRLVTALSRSEHLADRERARLVVREHGGDTLAYFALRDDKQWSFCGGTVVAYAVRNGVCLVSPDPIGPAAERTGAWADFTGYAQRNGWSISVIGAAPDWLPVYKAAGMRPVYLGDEAVVDCTSFVLEGRSMRSLRSAHSRVRRAGYEVSFHDPAALEPELRGALEPVVAQSRRGGDERGFSMTLARLFDPADTGLLLSVARREDGEVGGFIQWVPSSDIGGWSLDVMRRSTGDGMPNGLMDFLIIETIRYVAERGGRGIGLNFAVLRSVLASESDATAARLGRAVLAKVSSNTQMESLWRFNSKYEPSWRPRYVVMDSMEFLLTQGLVMADAEGVDEIPLVGRLVERGGRRRA